jgi:hypothetical protein
MQTIAHYFSHLLEVTNVFWFFILLATLAVGGLALGVWLDAAGHRGRKPHRSRPTLNPMPMDGRIRL